MIDFKCVCGSDNIDFDNDSVWCNDYNRSIKYDSGVYPIKAWIEAVKTGGFNEA